MARTTLVKLLLLSLAASTSGCGGDEDAGYAEIEDDGPGPVITALRREVGGVHVAWSFGLETSAFNVAVTRDGIRGRQEELPGRDRSYSAFVDEAVGSVAFSIQACRKAKLASSTCTRWTDVAVPAR